jgi:deoxyhypusine synthase
VSDAEPMTAVNDKSELITAFGVAFRLAVDDVHKIKRKRTSTHRLVDVLTLFDNFSFTENKELYAKL